eukprot:g4282.t1
MSFKVNDRVRDKKGECRGTVKYVGKVATSTKNPDFIWIGVQWDDPKRGKHDGETGGVRYFRCDENTSGSFAKPTKLIRASGLLKMLKERYEKDDTTGNFRATFDGDEGREFEVTLVGVEKIKKRQKLDVIESVSLENSNFGVAGEDAESIGKTCPKLRELHAPETLVGSWSEIANIVSQLPTLEVLNLSRNRIAEMSPKIEIGTSFSNLRSLILNRTGVSWNQVLKLERAVPKLEKLHLCGNNLSALRKKEDAFANLKKLDLSENPVEWKEVCDFAHSLKNLECLILNDTEIDHVKLYDDKSSFSNLRSLSLCGGKIDSWITVDELNRFPTLVSLKFSRQPALLKSLGPRQQRQQLVARVAGLLQLNSSDVRRRERDDAEKIYLHVVLSDAVSSSSSSNDDESKNLDNDSQWPEELRKMLMVSTRHTLVSQHPRLLELLRRHGLPPSLRSKSSGDKKMQGMVSLVLRSMATVSISKEPRTQRVPLRMKVGDLKRLCSRFFKVPPSQQRLKYREADDFSVPEELNDDKSVLAYYGVADGGTVFIHDDGDRK